MIERVIGTRAALALEFRTRLQAQFREAIATRGTCAMAVPGGSVAEAFLPALVQADVTWPRVDVCWSDERMVPADDPSSNWNVAWRLWLRHLPKDRSPRVHPMPTEEPSADVAAAEHEGVVEDVLRRSHGALDLALLGLGPDGHVASLFPGHPASREDHTRLVLAVHGAPKPPPDRLTLAFPVLARARIVVLAAFGLEKAEIVKRVVDDPSCELPAAMLVRRRESVLLLLDNDAASLLE